MPPVTLNQPVRVDETQLVVEKPKAEVEREVTTEAYVRIYFSDLPILAEIARCESGFEQTDKNGEVVRGIVNKYDVGVMQINEKYHLEAAEKLGLDIYSLEGNVKYARILYEKEGTKPWLASSNCWAKFSGIAER